MRKIGLALAAAGGFAAGIGFMLISEELVKPPEPKWVVENEPLAKPMPQPERTAKEVIIPEPVSSPAAKDLRSAEERATKVEAQEIQKLGRAGKETVNALNRVAWNALLARDFARALTASDRAIKLNPDNLEPVMNCAHALMFIDRNSESKDIYLAHHHETVGDSIWSRKIDKDFTEFDKVNLLHPLMTEVRSEFPRVITNVTCDSNAPTPIPGKDWGNHVWAGTHRTYEIVFPKGCSYKMLSIYCSQIEPPITPPQIIKTSEGFRILSPEKVSECGVERDSSHYDEEFRRPTGPVVSDPGGITPK